MSATSFAVPEGTHFVISGVEQDPLPGLVESFCSIGVRVTRDVVISGVDGGGDLVNGPGDFWFHTDAVFWSVPPRWMIIQVLEAEQGGELEVADSRSFLAWMPRGTCFFGCRGTGHTVDVVSATAKGTILRYRADYMRPVAGGVCFDALHEHMRSHLPAVSMHLGSLSVGDCLVLDNWTQLHRRRPFQGRRRIRRVWLDGRP